MNKHESIAAVTSIKDEAYDIAGAAMDVLNALGHGFHEKVYEGVLAAEFRAKKIEFQQQPQLDVIYKGENIGHFEYPCEFVFIRGEELN